VRLEGKEDKTDIQVGLLPTQSLQGKQVQKVAELVKEKRQGELT